MKTFKNTKGYISPSSLLMWEKNQIEWAEKYIEGVKAPQYYQQAMDTGTAFDVIVKGFLNRDLKLGRAELVVDKTIPEFDEGLRIMKGYIECGAYQGLLDMINEHCLLPINDNIYLEGEMRFKGEAPLLGYVDFAIVTDVGVIVLDWKVNGSTSKRGAKAVGGYCGDLSSWKGRKYVPKSLEWFEYNTREDRFKSDWKAQVSTYGACIKQSLGLDPFTPLLCGIEQIYYPDGQYGAIEYCSHRYLVENTIYPRYCAMWNQVKDLSKAAPIDLGFRI